MANAIITENSIVGSTGWIVTNPASTQIQAYCDKVSYNPGDVVSFFVSTATGGNTYTMKIYRLGYYQGLGGCLKSTSGTLTGVAQGFWDGTTLNSCPTAIINSTTHNCEAGWASSTTWTIPGGSVTGLYVAYFVENTTSKQTIVPFVVKGNSGADYCYIRPTTTDQAYNTWGGFSLYTSPSVGVKVSYNRPFFNIGTGGNLYNFEINFLQWAEKQGYNLTYYADIDIQVDSTILRQSKVLLSPGHDEYWTRERRDAWESAHAAGVSSAFLGANPCGWVARLENDNAGNPNRTLTCYKVSTTPNTLSLDPFFGTDNTRVTAQWRDALINRPENSMIGVMYSDFQNGGITGNVHWTVDASADTTYLAGTGLVAGSSYGTDVVGYEWDKIFSNGVSPANLKTIGTTSVTGANGAGTSNTTFYRHASGALVFATGSVGWTNSLSNYRYLSLSTGVGVPQMQVLMSNIMGALKGPVFSRIGKI